MLILASASDRRKDLLRNAGLSFIVHPADINEDIGISDPVKLCAELAVRKAKAVAAEFPNDFVLAADTVVYCGGSIFNKPADSAAAFAMLSALSGRSHSVFTGVCAMHNDNSLAETEESQVVFPAFTADFIESYIRDFRPFDKAGGYGLQELERTADIRVIGGRDNVYGLPVARSLNLLYKLGYIY